MGKILIDFANFKMNELSLYTLIENFPGHVYWKDIDGKYLGSNSAQAKNLGLNSVIDMLGKTDFELPWPEGVASQFRENDLWVMKTGCTKSAEENSQMDGKQITVLSRKSPLKNSSGEIIGVVGISLDITGMQPIFRTRGLAH
jgi:PAS domain S-box-containing protein